MDCQAILPLLDAYTDGELEAPLAAQVAEHLTTCERCTAMLNERQALKASVGDASLYRPAPAGLREQVLSGLPGSTNARRARAPVWAWGALAANILLAGLVAWLLISGPHADRNSLVREAVSSHIRSLMASHLADVATSDQHTVKPWFAGKLDFSPVVADHAAQGFPLTGGRLDYIAGRPVAAVVYQRRAHIINLFTCPDTATRPQQSSTDRGYNVVTWSNGAMRFCAVSDLAANELKDFADLVAHNAAP